MVDCCRAALRMSLGEVATALIWNQPADQILKKATVKQFWSRSSGDSLVCR
jgi:hypothetical protein